MACYQRPTLVLTIYHTSELATSLAGLLGLPETRSLIFLIKNSPDQAEGYLDYLQPLRDLSVEDINPPPEQF
jgi:hypothetical protein